MYLAIQGDAVTLPSRLIRAMFRKRAWKALSSRKRTRWGGTSRNGIDVAVHQHGVAEELRDTRRVRRSGIWFADSAPRVDTVPWT